MASQRIACSARPGRNMRRHWRSSPATTGPYTIGAFCLFEQAKGASGEAAEGLFAGARDKYAQAVAISPGDHDIQNDWGTLLLEEAKRASGEARERLFNEAEQR